MPGVGLRNRAGKLAEDSEVGMLDVSANALAVLILATMLVISAAAPPALRGEVRADTMPTLHYPSPLDGVLAPHSRYVIVMVNGVAELDLNGFAGQLATGQTSVRTEQGQAVLITDRARYRDLNEYRLSITPDWDVLVAQANGAASDAVNDVFTQEAATAAQHFQQDNTASTYLVAIDAVDAFSVLYWKLRTAQTPIRWATVEKGQSLVLTRRVENFERRARQWQ